MKKFQLFMFLITVGFFLMPSISMGCEMKFGKSCCNKEMSSKDCCKKSKESKHANHDHSCNGKCGNSNCVTSTVQFNLASFEIKFKNDNFDLLEKELNYIHSQDNLSSGFSSLWLIPKIS